jgi:PTH1 family peptidyl-tRNA hydrolase
MPKQENRDVFLVVGLGNPWEKYQHTRHNVGAWALDYFAKENNFPDFVFFEKFNSLNSKSEFKKKKIILAKPQTLMNDSGKAVKKLFAKYNPQAANLIIIHDDIYIGLGKIKIIRNCGAGGHKGVESIIDYLGMKNFVHIKVGVKPEGVSIETLENGMSQKPKNINLKKFVLEKFDEQEKVIIENAVEKTKQAIEMILEQGLSYAMNVFNKK